MKRPDIRRLPKRANPHEALDLLLKSVSSTAIQNETVALEDCLGRVLAQDVVSDFNIPDYDKTFIDGYAVNPEDTKGASHAEPVTLKIVGKLFPPDYPTDAQISRGEAMYVACGAPIPRGAASTVKVEETRLHDGMIEIRREIKAEEGIIPLGDDVKKGSLLLKRGQVLRPQDIGLMASLQMTTAEVVKKPRIAIISGGDELIKQRQKDPTKIVNNYALVVAGLASELGAAPKMQGIMPDVLDKVTAMMGEALESSDIVVTIGGSSVGVKDFVPDAINALGEPGVLLHGVLLRPGAISGFGLVNGKPLVMLPGHIGSCIAGFYLFVAPLISLYSGLAPHALPPRISAEMSKTYETGPRFRFLFMHLRSVDGKLVAEPVEGGSSALTTMVKANGYTIVPPHTKLSKGDAVKVFMFGRLELTQFC
jgi:molybdenum cofactor synthesis domain-containing protein